MQNGLIDDRLTSTALAVLLIIAAIVVLIATTTSPVVTPASLSERPCAACGMSSPFASAISIVRLQDNRWRSDIAICQHIHD